MSSDVKMRGLADTQTSAETGPVKLFSFAADGALLFPNSSYMLECIVSMRANGRDAADKTDTAKSIYRLDVAAHVAGDNSIELAGASPPMHIASTGPGDTQDKARPFAQMDGSALCVYGTHPRALDKIAVKWGIVIRINGHTAEVSEGVEP